MQNVVSLFHKKEHSFRSGKAHCVSCHHEWIAVTNDDSDFIECPNCRTHKGKFKYPFSPNDDTLIWKCQCGNPYFLITVDGHFCPNCGKTQTY